MAYFQDFWRSVRLKSELFGLLQVTVGEEGTENLVTNFVSTGNQTKDLCLRM